MQVERVQQCISGKRVSNGQVTYPLDVDSSSKDEIIRDNVAGRWLCKESGRKLALPDRPVSYQLVGGVRAYQGDDG